MPNTKPKTDTAENVELKQRLAEEKSYVDFGIIGLLVQDSVPAIKAMAEAGVVGYKCFLGETIGNIPAPDDGMMLDGLREIAATGLRIGFHAENNEIMQHLIRQMKEAGRTDPQAHVDSRPALAEVESIQRMGLYARHTGTRIHIFHLSSREGLDMIDEWRAKGVDVTTETGAHYVFKKAEDMDQTGVRLRMNPPVRWGSEGHGDYLLAGPPGRPRRPDRHRPLATHRRGEAHRRHLDGHLRVPRRRDEHPVLPDATASTQAG